LIDRWNIAHDEKLRTFELFTRRILGQTPELPEEMKLEDAYLKL